MPDGLDSRLHSHFDRLGKQPVPLSLEQGMLARTPRQRSRSPWLSLAVAAVTASLMFAVIAVPLVLRHHGTPSGSATTTPTSLGGLPTGLAGSYNDLSSDDSWFFVRAGDSLCQSLVKTVGPCLLIRTPASGSGASRYSAYGSIIVETNMMRFTITSDNPAQFSSRSRSCVGSTDVFDLVINGNLITLSGKPTNCIGTHFGLKRFG